MKTLAVIALLATTSFAAPDKTLDYDFQPPAFPADQPGMISQHFLPGQDGFAANINLMAQPFADTLEAYDKISREQFQQLGMNVITAELKDDTITYEYTGKTQGHEMHWYSRAQKQGDLVYLITATTLAKRWDEDSPKLIESVNSFKLN